MDFIEQSSFYIFQKEAIAYNGLLAPVYSRKGKIMKSEFTAIIEPVPEGGYWAQCPEIPGANGQGETVEEAKNDLRKAIELIFEDRRADMLRGLPEDAIRETVSVG